MARKLPPESAAVDVEGLLCDLGSSKRDEVLVTLTRCKQLLETKVVFSQNAKDALRAKLLGSSAEKLVVPLLEKFSRVRVEQRLDIFELWAKLLSGKDRNETEEIRKVTSRLLTENWGRITEVAVEYIASPKQQLTCHAFLSVWKKLSKVHMHSVHAVPSSMLPAYRDSTENVIVKCLENVNTLAPMCLYKVLDGLKIVASPPADHQENTAHFRQFQENIKCRILQIFNLETVQVLVEKYKLVAGGFLGVAQAEARGIVSDNAGQKVMRKLVVLILKCSCAANQETRRLLHWLGVVESILSREMGADCWLLESFAEMDDMLCDVMLTLLSAFLHVHKEKLLSAEGTPVIADTRSLWFPGRLHPHTVFLSFLAHTGWDSSLLVDFIISPETCFLLYLTKYLKYLCADWDAFREQCNVFESKNRWSHFSTPLKLQRQSRTRHDLDRGEESGIGNVDTPVKAECVTTQFESDCENESDIQFESCSSKYRERTKRLNRSPVESFTDNSVTSESEQFERVYKESKSERKRGGIEKCKTSGESDIQIESDKSSAALGEEASHGNRELCPPMKMQRLAAVGEVDKCSSTIMGGTTDSKQTVTPEKRIPDTLFGYCTSLDDESEEPDESSDHSCNSVSSDKLCNSVLENNGCGKHLVDYASSGGSSESDSDGFLETHPDHTSANSRPLSGSGDAQWEEGGRGADSVMDRCMAVLYRTSLACERLAEKQLIAFNIKPLLKLLHACEYLYEHG